MSPDSRKASDPGEATEHGHLVDLSSDMLGTIGFDGRLKTLNASWESSLGYGQHELLATPLLDLVHPDDHSGTSEAMLKAACAEGGRSVLINRCRCLDGSHKWISWRLKAAPAKKLYYAAARDVTHHKGLVQKMRRNQKMAQVGRLVVGVAHDFTNILAIIQGCAAMLKASRRVTHREDIKDIADILQAARRGAEFARGLIDYSRADRPQEDERTDLQEVFVRMENLLRRLLPEGISLAAASTDVAAKIRIRPSRLDQIVLNLVINARDAMPAGGRIELKARTVERDAPESPTKTTDYALISVSDAGVGMSPDVLARIGEPFFSTKAEGKGTGLGLATVREIVEECGGRIGVRSVPGAGTTFEIFLPLVEE